MIKTKATFASHTADRDEETTKPHQSSSIDFHINSLTASFFFLEAHEK